MRAVPPLLAPSTIAAAPGACDGRNVMDRKALRGIHPATLRPILQSRLFRATLSRPTVSDR